MSRSKCLARVVHEAHGLLLCTSTSTTSSIAAAASAAAAAASTVPSPLPPVTLNESVNASAGVSLNLR